MWTTCFQVSPHFDVLCIHSVGLHPLWLDFKQSCSTFFSCEIVFFSAGLPWQLRLFLRYAYSEAECGFLVGCTLREPCPRAGSRLQLLFLCRRRGLSALAFSCCVTSYSKPSNWKQLHCVLLRVSGSRMQARAAWVLCPGPRLLRSGSWSTSRLRPGPPPGSLDPWWSFAQAWSAWPLLLLAERQRPPGSGHAAPPLLAAVSCLTHHLCLRSSVQGSCGSYRPT